MSKRFLIISYATKDGIKEFYSIKGYILEDGEPMPSHGKIRKDCLNWANQEGDDFKCFMINQMLFVDEQDYNSFFGLE